MDLQTMARFYSQKSCAEFGVEGYNIPMKANPMVPFGMKGSTFKYLEDKKNRPREYIHQVIERSKQIPDPCKYSKIVTWT